MPDDESSVESPPAAMSETWRWLAVPLLLFIVMSAIGITWGLPSRDIDPYLFGDAEPWSGERIGRLARAADKVSATRGADVDVDPLTVGGGPVCLTESEEQAAAIYLRYRLYTHQPDEMITMMALAQMRPGQFDLDPRLYQYGGLFIYPVGALIKLGGLVGLIDVRSDLAYYLDRPEAFGRFYVAARLYVVLWGLLGVVLVYSIARQLGGARAGVLAALLFVLLPVVVCMAHEAKPHLPGAVLMLAAVWFAMRYVDASRNRDWWAMCVACGAAFGMVLSSLPIFIVIPTAEAVRVYGQRASLGSAVRRVVAGGAVAAAVYLLTNPYVPINLVSNREVLASNLSNSTAMYEVGRLLEGLLRMLSLTVEGATLPVLLIGVLGVPWLWRATQRRAWVLLAPAALFFVQFVLLAAGKPAEYGRFGVFLDAALAVAAALAITRWTDDRASSRRYRLAAGAVTVWVAVFGVAYLYDFAADTGGGGSRRQAAGMLASQPGDLAVAAEPAPYCCPPVNFAERRVMLFESPADWMSRVEREAAGADAVPRMLVAPSAEVAPRADAIQLTRFAGRRYPLPPAHISWANKPIDVYRLEVAGRP